MNDAVNAQNAGLAVASVLDRDSASEWYLENLRMKHFGSFANRVMGPFSPGLNVVYGSNESGKTTTAEAIRGVLFGWPRAGAGANAYKPEGAERACSLFMRDAATGAVCELARTKNSDEVAAPRGMLEAVDRKAFDTLFMLTRDELMGLDRQDELTARLLTAGSGTATSPAEAMAHLEAQIKGFSSRAAGNPRSLVNLSAERARLSIEVHAGEEQAMRLRDIERELGDLNAREQEARRRMGEDTSRLQRLRDGLSRLRGLDAAIEARERVASSPAGQGHRAADPSLDGAGVNDRLWTSRRAVPLALAVLGALALAAGFLMEGARAALTLIGAALLIAAVACAMTPAHRPPAPSSEQSGDQSHVSRDCPEAALDDLRAQRERLCIELEVPRQGADAALEALIAQHEERAARSEEERRSLARRAGELSQLLAHGRAESSFDRAKLELAAVEARMEDAQRELAMLLLAREALGAALARWEEEGQPRVYRRASELLARMTDGSWPTVRPDAQGAVVVADALGAVRAPHLLSSGTRQQLYLALRIALLETAADVGRGIPVLCDDVLVDFDERRRIAAVRALAELARTRQVILFTCHQDVASLVQRVDPQSKRLEL